MEKTTRSLNLKKMGPYISVQDLPKVRREIPAPVQRGSKGGTAPQISGLALNQVPMTKYTLKSTEIWCLPYSLYSLSGLCLAGVPSLLQHKKRMDFHTFFTHSPHSSVVSKYLPTYCQNVFQQSMLECVNQTQHARISVKVHQINIQDLLWSVERRPFVFGYRSCLDTGCF